MDREDFLWRRFAESGGLFGCRGCGGTEFWDQFQPTRKELELLLKGAFEHYNRDPYFYDTWKDEPLTETLYSAPFAPLAQRKEGVV